MELQKALEARRSVRNFTDRVPAKEEIDEILRAGILAPSACNLQSWYFYVVSDEAQRKLLKTVCEDWISTAPAVIIVCSDDEKGVVSMFGERARKLTFQDTALAMENMLLKAVELGLGGCIIAAYKQDKVMELFNIPKEHPVVALLPIGEPKEDIPAKDRKPLTEVARFCGNLPHGGVNMPKPQLGIRNTEARGQLFENCDLSESMFHNMSLCSGRFENIDLHDSVFTDANMRGTSYIHLNMDKMRFQTASAIGAVIGGCEECDKKGIHCVNMSESAWDNVRLLNVKMNHIDADAGTFTDMRMCRAKLYDVDLDGAEMSGINFVNAKIQCSNLFGSTVRNANLTNVALESCDIDGMTIDGVNVKEAIEAYKNGNK